MKCNFDYFYGAQADQFSFIRIPRVILTDAAFKDLSIQAKVLYGVLLDRMSLSRKNACFDKENRVFIIYQIGEIQEDLGFTKKKAMELLSELEKFGLLEKKRRGHGLPNILYVKSFMSGMTAVNGADPTGDHENDEFRGPDSGTSDYQEGDIAEINSDAISEDNEPMTTKSKVSKGSKKRSRGADFDTSVQRKTCSRSAESDTLEVPKPALLEVPKSAPLEVPILGPLMSNTKDNKTDGSYIESNHILPGPGRWTDGSGRDQSDARRSDSNRGSLAREYRELICANIEYENLLLTFPEKKELLEGVVDLILETVLTTSEEILIASNYFPAEIVRSKFLKLNYSHIRYVVDCLNANTTKVRNIKKYLLASLFNAPSTIDGYFTAEVNYDMAEFVARR